jgi:hypothetical protein
VAPKGLLRHWEKIIISSVHFPSTILSAQVTWSKLIRVPAFAGRDGGDGGGGGRPI